MALSSLLAAGDVGGGQAAGHRCAIRLLLRRCYPAYGTSYAATTSMTPLSGARPLSRQSTC